MKCGIKKALLKCVRSFGKPLRIMAYAEEPAVLSDSATAEPSDKDAAPTVSFEDLITKARNEERSKLRKKIEGLETQNRNLTEQHNADLLKIAGLERERDSAKDALAKAGGDAEKALRDEIADLKTKLGDANAKLKDVKPREEVEAEIREALKAEYDLRDYRREQLAAHPEIPTQMYDLVVGDDKKSIDKSIKEVSARCDAMRQQWGVQTPAPNQASPAAGQTPAPVQQPPFGFVPQQSAQQTPHPFTPVSGSPSVAPAQDTTTAVQQFLQLEPGSKEFSTMMKQLGL